MNLLELILKNDPNVQVQVRDVAGAGWAPHPDPQSLFSKIARPGSGWLAGLLRGRQLASVRGMVLGPGTRIRVKHASRFWPNYRQGSGSFQFCTLEGGPARVQLAWTQGDAAPPAASTTELKVGSDLKKAQVPPAPAGDMDLVIAVPPQGDVKLFFGVHRLLDRNELYRRCKGDGVEIGPGSKPQIRPAADTRVQYIEQATPDQWQKLYGKDTKRVIDPSLWDLYVVGNADRIPAAPGSLDFIFSSHVVEHLANPLGHLAYWATLLRPGGVIAAVIPDMQGCKDYVFEPSSLAELDAEYRAGSMEPTLEHYRRWCRVRAPASDPAEVLASGRSIHVHFYSPASMQAILQARCRDLGYRRCSVTSSPNHKDFFLLLEK